MKSLSRHDREVVFSSLLKSKEMQRNAKKCKEKQRKARKANKWDILPIFISGTFFPLEEKFSKNNFCLSRTASSFLAVKKGVRKLFIFC